MKYIGKRNNSVEVFNIFGNTGKFLAGIRDHCLKGNTETTTDPSYKQFFFKKYLKRAS